MDWLTFATKVPTIIFGAMQVVQKIKGASGPEKKAAVIASIPESIELTEFAIGRDLLNDPAVLALVGAYIDAEKVAMKARDALKAGLLAKSPVPEGVVLPNPPGS